ncbi:MAG: S8 family serine peptidase [Pseudomonadota bacterium]
MKLKPSDAASAALEQGEITNYMQPTTDLSISSAQQQTDGGIRLILNLPQGMTHAEATAYIQPLQQHTAVKYAEPNAIYYLQLVTPDDPEYINQWQMQSLNADNPAAVNLPAAWELTQGSENIVIGLIDSGVVNHTDLTSRLVGGSSTTAGYDLITQPERANDGDGRDTDPTDPGNWIAAGDWVEDGQDKCAPRNSTWHGTSVAGIIGAASNNATGVTGVDWNAKISVARATGRCGGEIADISDAIRWLSGEPVDGMVNPNPSDVINMSIGAAGTCWESAQEAIDAATARGTVVVVAAGNSNGDVANFSPANCRNVIAVAGLEQDGSRLSLDLGGGFVFGGNTGEEADIAAPSVGYLSTGDTGTTASNNTDDYTPFGGTSGATPHVSGVIGLMLASNPHLKTSVPQLPQLIEAKLKASARPFVTGTDDDCTTDRCGAGMLDAEQAVLAVSTPPQVDAGSMQTVYGGNQVTLTATATDDTYSDMAKLRYQWQQTGGTSVKLSDSNSAMPQFSAAEMNETLTFTVVATDDTGLSASDTVQVRVQAVDTNPDAFSFNDRTGIARSTLVESNTVTIQGIAASAPIRVANGEYRINNGAFTATSGLINNGDKVTVRHTSGAGLFSTTTTLLTIGDVQGAFSSTTVAETSSGGGSLSLWVLLSGYVLALVSFAQRRIRV